MITILKKLTSGNSELCKKQAGMIKGGSDGDYCTGFCLGYCGLKKGSRGAQFEGQMSIWDPIE